MVEHRIKHSEESIRSAFVKAGTLETFIRIGLDENLRRHIQSNEMIKIKLEIDIDPPSGFTTEVRHLSRLIPFSICTYALEDLFAGKIHALLCRPYKVRVKGRDWYDFIWYVNKGVPLHLAHLETRMQQSGHYPYKQPLSPKGFFEFMRQKIDHLDLKAAKEDLRRFIPNPKEIEGWSQEFFLSLLPQIQFTNPI